MSVSDNWSGSYTAERACCLLQYGITAATPSESFSLLCHLFLGQDLWGHLNFFIIWTLIDDACVYYVCIYLVSLNLTDCKCTCMPF